MRLTLDRLEREVGAWSDANWGSDARGDGPAIDCCLKVTEEVGELARALLRQKGCVGGSYLAYEVDARDAVADIVIALANLCHRKGWDMESLVWRTWLDDVRHRAYVPRVNGATNE